MTSWEALYECSVEFWNFFFRNKENFQLVMVQSDLANANNRKQQLERELMSVTSELRDQKQRLVDANSRISDLERQLQNSNSDKNRLLDRINELEKVPSIIDIAIFTFLSRTSKFTQQYLLFYLSQKKRPIY